MLFHTCTDVALVELQSMLVFVECQLFSERHNVFICLNDRVVSMSVMGHEALGITQNRNTLMLLSLKLSGLRLSKLCLHTSAVA